MRLGLYGGSFDPLHHGHLILAREALEKLQLDRVIFIPAAHSPHKLDTPPAPPEIRAQLVAAAIEGEPAFELDCSEFERTGPSFTIDTVESIKARHPDAELFYFIGADNVRELHTWRRIDDLRHLAHFVVFGRGDTPVPEDFTLIDRRFDVSSTDIRQRVAQGRSIRYLVPEAVRSLIAHYQLYQTSSHRI